MAKTHPLKAEKRLRTGSGKLNQMRREGWVPAVVYGRGQESANLKVNAKEFSTLLSHSTSEHVLVNLDVDGKQQLVLIQSVQHNAITSAVSHVDFLSIDEKTELHSKIPVVISGEAIGLKNGALIEQMVHDLEIRCLPADLPETITVDVSSLDVGKAIHIGDLKLPKGVKASLPAEVVVVICELSAAATSEA